MTEILPIHMRADHRYSCFADAVITLGDGTSVRAQLAELSSHGCYFGALVPIPVGTQFHLCISNGTRTCEVQSKVVYVNSADGLGIFGMGERFGKMPVGQRSAIDAWVEELASKQAALPPDPWTIVEK